MRACPQCGAPDAFVLGPLGDLTWVRCRDCGWEWNDDEVDVDPWEHEPRGGDR